jgi:hypothetical protein
MNQVQFNQMASVNIFNALWYAKYMGISAKVAKGWVGALMASLKVQ